MTEPLCECGHVRDEHVFSGGAYRHCDVNGCACVHFDRAEED